MVATGPDGACRHDEAYVKLTRALCIRWFAELCAAVQAVGEARRGEARRGEARRGDRRDGQFSKGRNKVANPTLGKRGTTQMFVGGMRHGGIMFRAEW